VIEPRRRGRPFQRAARLDRRRLAHRQDIEKQARSNVAKLPLAKDIEFFDFDGTLDIKAPMHELASANFADQSNTMMIRGIETGKSHLAVG
jgi:DNA replication protein DnaC